jgi:hypothetical protein
MSTIRCSYKDSASVSAAVAALEGAYIDANVLERLCLIRDEQTLDSFTRHNLEAPYLGNVLERLCLIRDEQTLDSFTRHNLEAPYLGSLARHRNGNSSTLTSSRTSLAYLPCPAHLAPAKALTVDP